MEYHFVISDRRKYPKNMRPMWRFKVKCWCVPTHRHMYSVCDNRPWYGGFKFDGAKNYK